MKQTRNNSPSYITRMRLITRLPMEPVKGKEAIKKMFADEFARANMTCIIENIFEDGAWGILEWKDPLGLRGCGFFEVIDGRIEFQRGYWDKLSFLRKHGLPFPPNTDPI